MGLFQQSVLANYLSAVDETETEWMEYFGEQKAKAEELKSQIGQTDKENDEMVYGLSVEWSVE